MYSNTSLFRIFRFIDTENFFFPFLFKKRKKNMRHDYVCAGIFNAFHELRNVRMMWRK